MFALDLKVGRKGRAQTTVSTLNTAKTMGSGQLEVFATPAMIALMEQAAVNALELPEGQSSVGTSLSIKHNAATPLGANVFAIAELVEVDRRKLVFTVEAFDDAGQIGVGKHERFVIDADSFIAKAQARNQGI